jgi:hypothetical protein
MVTPQEVGEGFDAQSCCLPQFRQRLWGKQKRVEAPGSKTLKVANREPEGFCDTADSPAIRRKNAIEKRAKSIEGLDATLAQYGLRLGAKMKNLLAIAPEFAEPGFVKAIRHVHCPQHTGKYYPRASRRMARA